MLPHHAAPLFRTLSLRTSTFVFATAVMANPMRVGRSTTNIGGNVNTCRLQLGVGGVGCKDIQRKHSIEDEISWRQKWGYADLTPKEIENELWDKGEIQERYL